jgi:hypothetical protein
MSDSVKAMAALFAARLDANAISRGINPYAEPDQIATIGTLEPGQKGFTVPWAFSLEYPVFEEAGGTVNMPVGRDADGKLWIGTVYLTALLLADHSGVAGGAA